METILGLSVIEILGLLVFSNPILGISDEIHAVCTIRDPDDVEHVDELHPEILVGDNLYRRLGETDSYGSLDSAA